MVILASSTDTAKRGKDSIAAATDPQLRDVQQHLIQKLQMSLDLNEVLRRFFEAVQAFLRIDGLTYTYDEVNVALAFGSPKLHRAEYTISNTHENFGKLNIAREQRFAEAELAALEILMGSLFFPLRNALLYRQAVQSSMRDPLTDVGNRIALSQALTREIELSKRFNRPFSLLLIDVDHFKLINDTIGHSAGDLVLQHLAKKITSNLRQIDDVFRYGGEEFVVLLGNTNDGAAWMVAERIRQSLLNEPLQINDQSVTLTVSIGLSHYRAQDSEDSLFDRADAALYRAKQTGRNRVMTDDMDDRQ